MNIIEFGVGIYGPFESLLEEIRPFRATFMITVSVVGASLFICALYYPLSYTIFKNKEEGLSIIVLLLSLVFSFFMLWIGIRLELSMNEILIMSIAIPTVLFILSYFLSRKIYKELDV
jgi:Zn-dependent protease with chaperone function